MAAVRLRAGTWLLMLGLAAGCATTPGTPEAPPGSRIADGPPATDPRIATGPDEDDDAIDDTFDGADGNADVAGNAAGRRRTNYDFDIEAPRSLVRDIRRQTLVGRWQRRADFSPIQFEGLVTRLEDEVQAILRAHGHFRGEVTVTSSPGHVRVAVVPGPQAVVSGVDLRITGPVRDDPDTMALIGGIPGLAPGRPFLPRAWQGAKRTIVDILNRQGYLRAEVTSSEAQVHVVAGTVALELHVTSGTRIAFGALEVQGLKRYDLRVVENLRPFSEGEPFNDAKLQEFLSRLRRSAFFSSVSAQPDLIALEEDPEADRVSIQVIVNELERRRTVLGIGYSTDEGVRGQAGFEHRDLFNRNLQMEAAVVLSAKRQRAFANFRTPFDRNSKYIGFGQAIEREDIENQVELRSNTYAGIGKREGDIDAFTSLQYQVESEEIFPGDGLPVEHNAQKALVLGKSWVLRRVDSTIDPREGYLASFQLSGALEGLLTDRSFVRLYARATRFQPLQATGFFKGGTLIGLLEIGLVGASSREEIPSENLFRAGGVQSIRGYSYQSLGVKRGNAVVGGRYLAVASLEYQHPITAVYSAAAFVDYGNAGDAWHEFDPVAGYGLGLRWRTPIGPVNLDLAYGQAVSRFRVHFSIGYTF